jgi:hypothetical protein
MAAPSQIPHAAQQVVLRQIEEPVSPLIQIHISSAIEVISGRP